MPQRILRSTKTSSFSSSQAILETTSEYAPTKAISPQVSPTTKDVCDTEEHSPQFSSYYTRMPVTDEAGKPVNINFRCAVSRGFFKIKEDWVCYRRNYINVSAELHKLPKQSCYVQLQDSDELLKITQFAFLVAAVTAADPPQPVDMIQLSAKRDKGPQSNPEFIQISRTSLKAAWSRLQYKVATANNGKKRGQQYFAIKVTMHGWIETASADAQGTWVELGDKYSEPMIVRGRSPGHYNDNDNDNDASSNDTPPSPPISQESSESEPEPKQGASQPDTSPPRAQFKLGMVPARTEWPTRQSAYTTGLVDDPHDFGCPDRSLGYQEFVGGDSGKMNDKHTILTLPPIHSAYQCCSNSRQKLPTYDELSRNQSYFSHGGANVDEDSPELQAALSLTAISHTKPSITSLCHTNPSPIPAMRYSTNMPKRRAEDDLSSRRSSKSPKSPGLGIQTPTEM